MISEPQSDVNAPRMLTMAVPSPAVARPNKIVEVVRAERELRAIDELMAQLTADFIADAKR